MAGPGTPIPRLRSDVSVKPVGNDEYVVKDRRTRAYFRIGPVESFLLERLDGVTQPEVVCRAFAEKFNEPLSPDELGDFVDMIRGRNLLETAAATPSAGGVADDEELQDLNGQSWLFFRKSLFDPDWILNRIEPWVRFLWTPGFLALSLACIGLAGFTLWSARAELVSNFPQAVRWETVALIWCTLVLITTVHEFAHGLTCKHFGGEVHEMGVLMIFFMPCFYCDVTDAWLIPRKSQRLWVTAAGGYSDLCVWACSVFLWRVTVPDSLLHYVTQVVLTTCGTRVFLNLNPLLRLDGYYLLGDWLEIPNLRVRARDYFMAHARWLFWGSTRPAAAARGGWLLIYGGVMWLVAVGTLNLLTLGLYHFVLGKFGLPGAAVSGLLLIFVSRRVFKGLLTSEFVKMFKSRHRRTALWAMLVIGVPAILFWVPLNHSATGEVLVRSGHRVEIHAALAGFFRDIAVEEGSPVCAGTVIGQIHAPDLESLLVRKRADIRECDATLAKLKIGPRAEEIAEQKARVQRAVDWVELARTDLSRARVSLEHGLKNLGHAVMQSETELAYARQSLERATILSQRGAFAGEQLRAEQKRVRLLESRLAQAEAEKQGRTVEGVRLAEAELARREKELADSRSALTLMNAGSRPEDIAAESAKLARLQEELKFLEGEWDKQAVVSTATGVVSTPRMAEKSGMLLEKGALVCVVEDMSTLSVEIEVDEDSIMGVQVGQSVELRIRALPFETFHATVERIAPSAATADQSRSRVKVHCHVDNTAGRLKAGMTGAARICRGKKLLGMILTQRFLKEFRTEFWW